LGYRRSSGLAVGLIIAPAAPGTPAPHVGLGVITPILAILIALIIGAVAGSRAITLSVSLSLAAAPTLVALACLPPLTSAAHLRQAGHRPEQNQGQNQD